MTSIRAFRVLAVFLSATIVLASTVSVAEARGRHCRLPRRTTCCCVQPVPPCRPVISRPANPVILSRGTFISPKTGTRYAFVETNEPGTEWELEQRFARTLSPAQRLATSGSPDFVGHDRKDAKTSIATGDVENLDNLDAVLGSLVPDQEVLDRDPPITEDADSERVDLEQRNVHVPAFLYATKQEADNDYHLILGSNSSPPSSQFMTAEISGLPRTGPDRERLKVPRKAFEDHFADSPIGGNYRKFDPPIPVEITGSLFFDVDHRAGVVGPAGMKPQTAWEIHPVIEIIFEPGNQQ